MILSCGWSRIFSSVIRLDGILFSLESVIWQCKFHVIDQCFIWNLHWSGEEDFSQSFDIFQSIMSVKLGRKQGFVHIVQLISWRLQTVLFGWLLVCVYVRDTAVLYCFNSFWQNNFCKWGLDKVILLSEVFILFCWLLHVHFMILNLHFDCFEM